MHWSLSNIWLTILKQCQGYLERIFNKPWPGNKKAAYRPLLNKQDLHQIHIAATTPDSKWITSQHEVSTMLIGERSSAYAGSGYEFADNQRYIAGDDSRFINWRVLARTGKLYRKVFHEERRPQLWIVLDKRSSMRFGSSKRLKVTQAAIHAICHLYQAQQHQLACGGVVVNESPSWVNPVENINTLQPLIEQIIAPAPPLFTQQDNDSLNFILRQLIERLSSGSIVVLISDYYDLDNDMLNSLYTLVSNHTVIAKHIIDPLEMNLPEHGKFQVTAQQNATTLTLDCNDNTFRQKYRAKMKQQQEHIENQLVKTGVIYQLCTSDEDIINETDHE